MLRHGSKGPGHGGPANGPGYGGPANGQGKSAKPFSRDYQPEVRRYSPEERAERTARRAEQAERILDRWAEAADVDETTMISLMAGDKFLNRVQGLPVARTLAVSSDDTSDLDDDALAARRAELDRELHQAGLGAAATPPQE